MADVTIYGNECEFCGKVFETIDNLVRHLVENHDELWDYEKPAEESLKSIKLDKKVLKGLIRSDLKIKERGTIECKFCGKRFGTLDAIAQHVMFDHPVVALSAYQHGGLYISAEFLLENKFVENFEEYCRSCENFKIPIVENTVEKHFKNDCVSEDWEVVDSDDEWESEDAREKHEDEVKKEPKKSEVSGVNLDSESKGSEEESEKDMEFLREDTEKAEENSCEFSEYRSTEVDRLCDISLEDRAEDELYSCERRDEVYDTEDDLKIHVGRYHEAEESCMFCNFRGRKMDLIDHLSSDCDIDIDQVQRVSEPEETCKERGDVLDTVDDLRTHGEEYHEGFKETCDKCGDIFGSVADLETHVKRYHEGRGV